MDLAIRNGTVRTPDGLKEVDVGVQDGTITEIGTVTAADRTVDASGTLVLPGFVNAHTHTPMTLLRGYADDLPLQRWLEDEIWPVEDVLTADDVETGARLAALEMIKTGTTTFGDMYGDMDRVAQVVEETGLRATLGRGVLDVGKSEAAVEETVQDAFDFAEQYHGAADGRIRTMIAPHAPYTCSDETLERLVRHAANHGYRFHIHLSETADEVRTVEEQSGDRPPAYLDDRGCWELDAYVAHAVHLSDEDIQLLADREVGVAHCPAANMKLAAGTAPVPALLDAGVTVGLGTDGPASNNNLDMVREMYMAALLAKVSADDAAALPADAVLDMATRHGAHLLGHDTGTITEGAPADIVLMDMGTERTTPRHDLVSHAVYAATGADVRTTIVEGDVLMHDNQVAVLDEARVLREAEDAATALVDRAD